MKENNAFAYGKIPASMGILLILASMIPIVIFAGLFLLARQVKRFWLEMIHLLGLSKN